MLLRGLCFSSYLQVPALTSLDGGTTQAEDTVNAFDSKLLFGLDFFTTAIGTLI